MLITIIPKLINNLKFLSLMHKLSLFYHFYGFFITKKYNFMLNLNDKFLNLHTYSWLNLYLLGIIKGYKLFLELKGMGYKYKLISTLNFFGVTLRVGYSNIIYLKTLNFFRILFFNKSVLCFYTNNLWLLNNYVQLFFFQRKNNIYKVKGFFFKNTITKLKKSTKLRF